MTRRAGCSRRARPLFPRDAPDLEDLRKTYEAQLTHVKAQAAHDTDRLRMELDVAQREAKKATQERDEALLAAEKLRMAGADEDVEAQLEALETELEEMQHERDQALMEAEKLRISGADEDTGARLEQVEQERDEVLPLALLGMG